MESEPGWGRVANDHPERCQATVTSGQCEQRACTGSKFCRAHGGHHAEIEKEKLNMRNYRLAKFKERATELSESDGISSLRDEVALLRMLIEERINKCKDTTDLLLVSGPLSDLIIKVDKVVCSMNKLESNLGQHLDKTKVIQYAQMMIEIIDKYISNPEILDAIGEDFFKAMTTL